MCAALIQGEAHDVFRGAGHDSNAPASTAVDARAPDLIGYHHKENPAMTKLTTATRKKIPAGEFGLPGRRYPIEDEAHARNALARVSQDGTPSEKATVRRKVRRLFPDIKQGH